MHGQQNIKINHLNPIHFNVYFNEAQIDKPICYKTTYYVMDER